MSVQNSKIMHNIASLISLCLVFSSCAIHSGSLVSSSVIPNAVHEDLAVGVAASNHFLGMGGIKRDALIFDTRTNMIANRPLESNESYGLITMDIKRSFFIIGYRTKVTLIADVVRPATSMDTTFYSAKYLSKIPYLKNSNSIFSMGDEVYASDGAYSGHIQGFNRQKARVVYTTKNGNTRTKAFPLERLYLKHDLPNEQSKIGDTIGTYQVIGIGEKEFLLFGPLGYSKQNR